MQKQVRLKRNCVPQLQHATPDCIATAAPPSHVFHLIMRGLIPSPQVESHLSHKLLLWQDHTPWDLGPEPSPDDHLLCIPGLVFKEHPFHSCTRTYTSFYPSGNARSGTSQQHHNTATQCLIFRSTRYLQLMEATRPVPFGRPGQ